MPAIESLKPLGALSAAILTVGLILVTRLWPRGLSKTFSQHVATSRQGILYYILLFSIVLPMLLIFFISWFIPTFNLPLWFTILLGVAVVTQYLCTLIPESGGKKSQYHRLCASVSAFALLPMLAILGFSNSVSSLSKIISVVCLLIMLGVVAVIIINKAEHTYLLLLQSAYFLAFFIAIFSVTYLA